MVRNEKGQSLVETALVLPILLLLIVGIIDFGRVLYFYSHLQLATQETARLGGLGKTDIEITDFARDYIDIGDPAQLSITITPNQASRTSGDYVTVNLEFPVTLITPIISSLVPNPVRIHADSTIRVE
ncbi:TadE/TadG family type IV pilus assembly protein [Bacillus salitolerans]|uniref:TadE/TadG family type IV pilus assembly protein n=1 Tax=Bacillus salitolerans TaxID=1437434 RepID=A0ABW4LJ40_9BACI